VEYWYASDPCGRGMTRRNLLSLGPADLLGDGFSRMSLGGRKTKIRVIATKAGVVRGGIKIGRDNLVETERRHVTPLVKA